MSYTKTNWATGDTITATKLNHMEDGIATGGGVLVVGATMENETITLDKTWQQIHDAPIAILKNELDGEVNLYYLSEMASVAGEYRASFVSLVAQGDAIHTKATTADGYPVFTEG